MVSSTPVRRARRSRRAEAIVEGARCATVAQRAEVMTLVKRGTPNRLLESPLMPFAPAATPPQQLSLFDAAPPAPAPAPAQPGTFRHPRSQREIRLGEHLVAYELRRARRRSIGFVVGADGLSVSAPRWV